MFINGLNQDLSLPIKRARTGWKTMPISDLANLASQLFHTLDKSPQRKPAIILNIQVQQINSSPAPKRN